MGRRLETTSGQRYHRQDRPGARDRQDRQEKQYRHLNLTFQDTCVGQQFLRCLNLIQLFRPSRKKNNVSFKVFLSVLCQLNANCPNSHPKKCVFSPHIPMTMTFPIMFFCPGKNITFYVSKVRRYTFVD